MRTHVRRLPRWCLAALCALLCASQHTRALAAEKESLNAYIPAAHKTLYEEYNLLVLGDLSVAKTAVRGAVAVSGRTQIEDFDFAADKKPCNKESRALTVGGVLAARMGSINNGYTVAGKGSKIHHSVRMACTNRVERYSAGKGAHIDFSEVRTSLIKESGDLCVTPESGTVETVNETMIFTPIEGSFSCYSVFKVQADAMAQVNKWKYGGGDFYRNIVINVVGKLAAFREFRMVGFNPRRTLISFCATYGKFDLINARIHANVLAPTASFTATETVINGSVIVGDLRGTLAILNVPYVTC